MIEVIKDLLKRNNGVFRFSVKVHQRLLRLMAPLQWRKLRGNNVIKLELGAGFKKGSGGWTTVAFDGADINYDLRKGIPLPDNSVDVLYSSHMLEHIQYKHLLSFLAECLRVLKPGGEFSVCVPNTRLYIEAYIEGRMFRERDTFYPPAMVDTGSLMDQLNYVAYLGNEHAYMFDEENLINTLKKGGFANAEIREFEPELDIEWRDYESIYAVASKSL